MGLLGDPVGGTGRWGIRVLSAGGALIGLGYASGKACLLEGGRGRALVRKTFLQQVYYTAGQALPLLTVTSLCVGSVVYLIAAQLLEPIGLAMRIRPSAELFLRELMPMITILVIIGRSGTAMATELGTMKVDREDEILDAMAINWDYFVIFPRLAAMIVSLLLLNLYVFALSLLGGEWLAKLLGFLGSAGAPVPLMESIGSWPLGMIAIKSVIFGAAVSLLSCYYGLSVNRSPTEVPKMATGAVITSIFVCFMLDLLCIVAVRPTA